MASSRPDIIWQFAQYLKNEFSLKDIKTKRLYQSKLTDKVEGIIDALDIKKGEIIVRIESKNEYPNYYIRNIKRSIS
mgnify:CR=1 FL=1